MVTVKAEELKKEKKEDSIENCVKPTAKKNLVLILPVAMVTAFAACTYNPTKTKRLRSAVFHENIHIINLLIY